jgi:hypothetical protein
VYVPFFLIFPFYFIFFLKKKDRKMSSSSTVKQYKTLGEEVWKTKVDKIVTPSFNNS